MSESEMDRHYREDYAVEQDCREVVRRIERLLGNSRLQNHKALEHLEATRQYCQRTADHIVAVWD